jgi:hypothetical protein
MGGPVEPATSRVTRRCAIALIGPASGSAPPPGIAPDQWRAALAEDVSDLLAGLANVQAAVAATMADRDLAESLIWPGTPIFTIPEPRPVAALLAAADAGYSEAAVIAADAPDLPALHIGKLFRGLGSHPVAAAPAAGGGLVGLAARLPIPEWLVGADPAMESATVASLRAAGPAPRSVAAAPSWHRLRVPADVHLLDPGLEGWDATRALLGG